MHIFVKSATHIRLLFVLYVDVCLQCIFTTRFLSTYLKTRRWMSCYGAGCWSSKSSPVSPLHNVSTHKCVRVYTSMYTTGMRVDLRVWYMNTHVVEKDAAGTCPPRVVPFPVQTSHTGEEEMFLILSRRNIGGFTSNVKNECQFFWVPYLESRLFFFSSADYLSETSHRWVRDVSDPLMEDHT